MCVFEGTGMQLLIEPVWNRNQTLLGVSATATRLRLLIEPVWNRN